MFRIASAVSAWWYGAPVAATIHPLAASSSSSSIVTALAGVSGIINNVVGSGEMTTDANDELGIFQKSIIDEVAKLSASQAVWRQRKTDLLGAEEQINQPLLSLQTATNGSIYSRSLTAIKNDLVEIFTTPQAEIRQLLGRSRPHLDEQQASVNALVKSLHETSDEQEQKRIKVQICDINIDLLREFIAMINDIKVKIESSLAVDFVGEKIALSFLETTLLLMAQIAFPSLDAQVESGLRGYMGRSIRESGGELDEVLVRLEGEIAQAWRHVDLNKVETASAADAAATPIDATSAPTPPPPVDTSGILVGQPEASPSATGLFAAAALDIRAALRTSADAGMVPATPAFK